MANRHVSIVYADEWRTAVLRSNAGDAKCYATS